MGRINNSADLSSEYHSVAKKLELTQMRTRFL